MLKRISLGLLIVAVLVVGAIFGIATYSHTRENPTTDDGVVVSDVIQIASRVDGPIIRLAVSDHQRVKRGQLLYEIDPEEYEVALAKAAAALKRTEQEIQMLNDSVTSAEAAVRKAASDQEYAQIQYERKKFLAEEGAVSQSHFDRASADLKRATSELDSANAQLAQAIHSLGDAGDQNALFQQAIADQNQQELNLSYTLVVAPQTGYVTNLRITEGTYTTKGAPALTLISDEAWRVVALMRENQLKNIQPGQSAEIYLPAYPNQRFRGIVQGIGWGISPEIIQEQTAGLTETSPTLDWVRLAQRFPVQVTLIDQPPETPYRLGMTATVQINTTEDDDSASS